MKQLLSLLLISLITGQLSAQRPVADEITSSKGNIKIQPILHASVVFTWNNKVIYVDPHGGAKAYKDIKAPDLILITDIHPDHLDIETLNALQTSKAKLIVPQAVAEKLPDAFKSKAIVLENGQKVTWDGVLINAIAMYNLPETKDAMHTRGRGNGYTLNLGGKIIYLSGDTGDIYEMRSLKNIDVAFVCMNLPYTMNIDQAASAVLEFMPKIVYAYHYKGKDGLSDTEAFKKLVNKDNKDIDVRLRNWYPEY